MHSIIDNIHKQAKSSLKKIILVDQGNDIRIDSAAKIIKEEKLAQLIIVNQYYIESNPQLIKDLTKKLYQLRKSKKITLKQAQQLIKNPLYFATMMLHDHLADGLVAGAQNTTADTLRPALQIIKNKADQKIISTFSLITTNNEEIGHKGLFIFSDCGLNINPNPEELAEITIQSAKSFKELTGVEAKIALLSYSTNNSSAGQSVDKIKLATKLAQEKDPSLLIEGEIQADAAIIPEIAIQKNPSTKLKGQANVLIFPDLNSGNITYKLVERIAGAHAFGPLTQGIKQPVNDLSRGCSSQDIITTVAITAVQSNAN